MDNILAIPVALPKRVRPGRKSGAYKSRSYKKALLLFRAGKDTVDIAVELQTTEANASMLVAWAREMERMRR